MSHQNKVSIDLIQDYQTLIGFSSDMIIFFGLSGKRTISTSQHVYELSAAGILVINPFVHYRLECLEPGSLLALKVPQDILQMAGLEHSWIDCYAANDFWEKTKSIVSCVASMHRYSRFIARPRIKITPLSFLIQFIF